MSHVLCDQWEWKNFYIMWTAGQKKAGRNNRTAVHQSADHTATCSYLHLSAPLYCWRSELQRNSGTNDFFCSSVTPKYKTTQIIQQNNHFRNIFISKSKFFSSSNQSTAATKHVKLGIHPSITSASGCSCGDIYNFQMNCWLAANWC